MAFDWSDLVNAALGIYAINQGNRAPKFYTAPPTPEEAWRTDATKNLYNTASQYTNQFLGGLGDMNPDFKLNTNLAGNPAFMGGIKLPKFNMGGSQLPPAGAPTAPPPAAGPPTGGQPSGTPGAQTPGVPGAGGNDPFYGMTEPGGGASHDTTWSDVLNFAKQYGPQAIKLVLGGGLMTLGTSGAMNFLKNHFGGNHPGGGADSGGQYTGNPNPTGATWTTPGTPGSGISNLDDGNGNSNVPWDPANWWDYNPLGGSSTISGLLGQQQGGQGDPAHGGRKAF